MNWYKLSKSKSKRRKYKQLIEPYVIDEDGVLKYKTPWGLMIAEDDNEEQNDLEKESKRRKNKGRKKKDWDPNPWAVCVPPDTLILGDNKAISDYEIGNSAIGCSGLQSVVTTFARKFDGYIYEIESQDLLPITITGEHPVLVVKSNSKNGNIGNFSKEDWEEVRNLIPVTSETDGHYLLIPRLSGQVEAETISLVKYIKNNKKNEVSENLELNFPLNTNTAWMLGLFVARGFSCRRGKGLRFIFNENEKEYPNKLIQIAESLNLSYSIKKQKKAGHVEFLSSALSEAFMDWCGNEEEYRKIPEFILLHKDSSILQSFIDGYTEGRGNENENGIEYCLTSKILATQLQLSFSRLGIVSSISKVKKQKDYYVFQTFNSKNQDMEGFNKRILDNYVCFPIRSIKQKYYSGFVYNMETADHTYLVNNVVVHNCHTTVDRDKDPEKFERCVMKVKEKQKSR